MEVIMDKFDPSCITDLHIGTSSALRKNAIPDEICDIICDKLLRGYCESVMEWVDETHEFWKVYNEQNITPYGPQWQYCKMSLKVTKFYTDQKRYVKYVVGESEDLYQLPFSALYDLLVHLSVLVRGIISATDVDASTGIGGYEDVRDEHYIQCYDQDDQYPQNPSQFTECHEICVRMSVDDSDCVQVDMKVSLVSYEIEFQKIIYLGKTSSDFSNDECDCTQIRDRTMFEVCPGINCHSTNVFRGAWYNKCLDCGGSWRGYC
jgi:hypothetical protein